MLIQSGVLGGVNGLECCDPRILSPAPELAAAMLIWALVVILEGMRRWRSAVAQFQPVLAARADSQRTAGSRDDRAD